MVRGRALAAGGRYRRVALFSVDGTRSSRQDLPIRGLVRLFYFVLVRVSVECLCVFVVPLCWCLCVLVSPCVRAQACWCSWKTVESPIAEAEEAAAKFVTRIVAAETHA